MDLYLDLLAIKQEKITKCEIDKNNSIKLVGV